MRKFTLMIIVSLLSFCTYGQLAMEGFESPWTGTPAAPQGGWVVYNQIGNITWKQTVLGDTNTPAETGSYAAYLQRENVSPGAPIPTNWLITPQFNGPLNAKLNFSSRLTVLGDQGSIYKIKIAIVTDSSVPVQNLPWVDLVAPMSEFVLNPTQTVYNQKSFALPAAYIGQQIRIAFIMEGDNMDRWLIDNVEVVTPCDPPSNLSVANITTNSAELNWSGNASTLSWEIENLPALGIPTGTGVSYSGTLPYIQGGLTENSDYKFYVRSVCTGGVKSDWIGPFPYSTNALGEYCSDPIVIPTVLPYSTTNNTANFGDHVDGTPGTSCVGTGNYLNGNEVIYAYTATTNGNINITLSNTGGAAGLFVYSSCSSIGTSCLAGAVASASASAIIPSFAVTANTTYYFVVSTNGTPQTTPYTLIVQQVGCNEPTALTANGNTSTSANLSWNSTATAWQIVVQNAGLGLPTGNGQNVTQNTNLNITATTAGVNFSPATNYEYYVRANCNNGTYSIWSGPFAFSTTQVPVALPYIENFDGTTHGFSIVNGNQANKWYVGNATAKSPANSLYISNDNGLTNAYTITSASIVHAYRDVIIPPAVGQLSVSFDLKVNGQSNADFVRAWLVPTTFVPTAGTAITTANSGGIQVGGNLQLTPDWTLQNLVVEAAALSNSTRRLVFEWTNNTAVGTQTPGAIDNLAVKVISCSSPTTLTLASATPNSATFNWVAPGGTTPSEYEYYYSTTTTAPTETTVAQGSVSAPATSATIPSLSSSQTYYVWVRSSCGASGKSFWTGPVSVIIPQVPANLDLTQNFDGPSHEFSFLNGTQINKWVVGSATSSSAAKSLYITNDEGLTNGYANSSPACVVHAYRDINIPAGATEVAIEFDFKCLGENGAGSLPVDYMRVWMVPVTFAPTPGTQIIAAGAGSGDRIKVGGDLNNSPEWTTKYLATPVTAYAGTTRRLVFEWRNDFNNVGLPAAALDNLNIKVVTCDKPTNLAVKNVTNTTATLDWDQTGTASNWQILLYEAEGHTPPSASTSGVPYAGISEYTLTPGAVTYGTQYVYYIRTMCGSTVGNSQWAGPFYFTLRPVNDDCSTPTPITVSPDLTCTNFASGNVYGATASTGITTTCTGTPDDDIWYEFVATSPSVNVNFSNITNSTQLTHTLYSGNCTALSQVTSCGTITANATTHTNLVVGQTYKLRIWTFTSTPLQKTTFQLCLTTPPAPPVNDEFAGALTVPVSPNYDCENPLAGSVISASQSSVPLICTATGLVASNDVWFKFVAQNTTHKIKITGINGSTTDMLHELHAAAGTATTPLYCSDADESFANNLIIGQTYYIRVYTKVANSATIKQNTTFSVCVGTPPPAPVNDECANAIVVLTNPTTVCDNIVNGTIASATASPQANTCSNTADDDVWFEFVATSTAHIIDLKNVNSGTDDLYHSVYQGSACGSLTQLYCSDINQSLASNLTVGQTYKIRVWSATSTPNQSSKFQLCVSTPPPPAPNDECANATILQVNQDANCNLSTVANVYGATASPEPNTCGNTNDDDDIWFEFTATHTTHLISLSYITGTTSDLYHVVYSGDQCGSLTQLYCSDANASTAANLIVGNTYKIRVYSNTTDPNQTSQFNICVRVPNSPIDVITDTYSIEQLVSEVLINSECALVSNITSKSQADQNGVASIAYFDANGATFPFNYGVVMSTGNALLAEGPFVNNTNIASGSTTWPGDAELNNITVANDPTQTAGTNDASIIEFDFVPLTNKFSFDFLFASTEYGSYQCDFTDSFAFILTEPNGNKKNLAVIPGTNIPVSVTNIKDGQYNASCGSQNIEYFGQNNFVQPLGAAINFNGQTIPMKAEADVVPGEIYHIKLVIADYRDRARASAVFLGGGSFDIGDLDLGGDLLVANGTALCDTETHTLDSGMTGSQYDYTWFKDGIVIPNATESTYIVTEPGTYGVQVSMDNVSCTYEGKVVIENYTPINQLTGNPANLTACDASGFSSFDLTPNVDALLAPLSTPADYSVTIHLTQDDANNGVNAIDSATYTAFANTTENLQTLWTRTVYNTTTCYGIKPFDLIVQDLTPVYTITPDYSICEGTSGTIEVVITDTDSNPVTYTWTKDGAPLVETTASITVTEAGAYTVVLDRTGCTATSTVNVAVIPTPLADAPADVTACGSYELPVLSANNNYYNATTNTLVVAGTVITETTTFNIVASSGTTPECTAQNTFTVTINNTLVIPAIDDVTACDSYTLPALAMGNYYTEAGGPTGTGTLLNEGDTITASQTIYVYAETGTVPNCTAEISFEVTITTSPVADAPADVNVCDSYELPALTTGNEYYAEQGGMGNPIPAGTILSATQTIYVFAKNGNCTDENAFTVNITPTPVFTLGAPQAACAASNITITVSETNFSEGEATYAWTLDGSAIDGGSSIVASGFGIYTLTVTVNNCTHSESVEITQNNEQIDLLIIDGCEGGDYMIEVTDADGSFNIDTASYSWTGPNGFTSTAREFVAPSAGEYFVTVTTAEGCTGEDSIIVSDTSCEIQRGISPNGDGMNDVFDLTALNVKKLSIFNRYGQEVYSKNDYKKEWGGQANNGNELPTGTYFYVIERATGENNTGWIYINRQQ